MPTFTLTFESRVRASPERAWAWVSSVEGILAEMRPLARMTVPEGVDSILDLYVEPGKPLMRSWLLLFGLLPVERTDLTLVEVHPGRGFVEESPMLVVPRWRHERLLDPVEGGCRIRDRLVFEPRAAGRLVAWLVSVFFRHRHRVLRRELGELDA